MFELADLEDTPYRILYEFDYSSSQFSDNQTVCMAHMKDNWVSNGCETTYRRENGTLLCECRTLNNYFYGLVNDNSRVQIIPEPEKREIIWPLFFVFVPMVLLMGLPCVGAYLDNDDRKKIEESNIYAVTDDTILNLSLARNYPVIQALFYKLKDIEAIQNWTQLTFCSVYWLISWNMHPLWSFLRRYDYRDSRSLRGTILMF